MNSPFVVQVGPSRWVVQVAIDYREPPAFIAILKKAIVAPRNWTTTLSRILGKIAPVLGRKAWERNRDGSRRPCLRRTRWRHGKMRTASPAAGRLKEGWIKPEQLAELELTGSGEGPVK